MSREESTQKIIQSFIAFRKGIAKGGSKFTNQIPHAQVDAILCIFEKKKLSVSGLANMLHITPGAATQLVDALIKAGLIMREADENDRRVTHVMLSAEGAKAVLKVKTEKLRVLESTLSPLSDLELETLAQLLEKVRTSVQENGGEQ